MQSEVFLSVDGLLYFVLRQYEHDSAFGQSLAHGEHGYFEVAFFQDCQNMIRSIV